MAILLALQGVLIAGAVVLFIRLLSGYLQERRMVYPPGPRGLPFFGSFFPLILGGRSQGPQELIQDWTEQYGAIFTFKLLGTRVYALNDAMLIKEAFADSPHVSGRASFTAFDTILGRTNTGVGFSRGDVWKEQRRFFLNFFRKGSTGSMNRHEGFVQAHAQKLVSEIEGHAGAAFNPWDLLNIYVAINVAKLVTGVTYESDDEELRALNRTVNRLFDVMGPGGLMSCVPLLSSIPSPVKSEIMKLCSEIDGFVRRAIDAHQDGVDQGNEAHVDLIGHFLKEMTHREAQGNPGSFDLVNLRMTCVDALAPGQESATTVLQWAIFTLALHPDAQARVREEIFDVVGTDRIPSYSKDHQAMPITVATITECMRLRPTVSMPTPHLATEDCKVGGYDVPRDSVMVANLSHLALSPTLWSDPAEFRPERFLDERGNLDLTREPFPFGYGRRACPGEGLARIEIFIFITSILQHFTLSLPEGAPRTNVGKQCLTYRPDPYQIHATRIA